jgi:hypothetical protein
MAYVFISLLKDSNRGKGIAFPLRVLATPSIGLCIQLPFYVISALEFSYKLKGNRCKQLQRFWCKNAKNPASYSANKLTGLF